MRTDQRTVVALDADRRVQPESQGDVALLHLWCERPGAIDREDRDRQHVALARDHHRLDLLDKVRRLSETVGDGVLGVALAGT